MNASNEKDWIITRLPEIWSVIKRNLSGSHWQSLDEIYRFVENSLNLDDEDFLPQSLSSDMDCRPLVALQNLIVALSRREATMSCPHYPHSGRKKHYWRIRKEGFRELLIRKGWHLRGTYAEKKIQGRMIIQFIVANTEDYYLCSFQLKRDFWAELDMLRVSKALDSFDHTSVVPS